MMNTLVEFLGVLLDLGLADRASELGEEVRTGKIYFIFNSCLYLLALGLNGVGVLKIAPRSRIMPVAREKNTLNCSPLLLGLSTSQMYPSSLC